MAPVCFIAPAVIDLCSGILSVMIAIVAHALVGLTRSAVDGTGA